MPLINTGPVYNCCGLPKGDCRCRGGATNAAGSALTKPELIDWLTGYLEGPAKLQALHTYNAMSFAQLQELVAAQLAAPAAAPVANDDSDMVPTVYNWQQIADESRRQDRAEQVQNRAGRYHGGEEARLRALHETMDEEPVRMGRQP